MAGTSRKTLLNRMLEELKPNKEDMIGWHVYHPMGSNLGYCFINPYCLCILNDTYDFYDAKEMKTTEAINSIFKDKRSDSKDISTGNDLRFVDPLFDYERIDMNVLKEFIKVNGGRRAFKNGINYGMTWKIGDASFNPIYLYDMACIIHGSQTEETRVFIQKNNSFSCAWFYNGKFEVGVVLPTRVFKAK